MDTLIIAPRWGGRARDDFYPWLTEQLGLRLPELEVVTLDTPGDGPPTPRAWASALGHALAGLDAAALARTVLLGHSVGGHAMLRAVAGLPPLHRALALVWVAGWWDISRATWDGFGLAWSDIEVWLRLELDDAAVREHAEQVVVLLSDDDPIPASSVEEATAAFQRRLGAEVRQVPGRQHFNAKQEVAVLDAVVGLFDPPLSTPSPR